MLKDFTELEVALGANRYDTIKQWNAARNLDETHQGYSQLESWPRYVLVELTQGCNLRCPMCRPSLIRYRDRAMDRGMLSAVANLLFPAAEVVDIRGWGESLIAPDAVEIINLVAQYHARCRVVTNLSFRRPAVIDALVNSRAMVDVSLDAASQSTLDICRTGAKLEIIDANLRQLVAGMKRQPDGIEALRIIATVQRSTLAELPGLVAYVGSLGIRTIVLNEVTLSEGDPNALTGLGTEVDQSVKAAIGVAAASGVELYAGTRLGNHVGLKKNAPFCIHPWSYATVGFDGSIGFCDHLIGPMMRVSRMGDINVSNFDAIWNGESWQALRRWHASRKRGDSALYGACATCYKHRNVDFEDVFEPALERYRLSPM